MVEIKNLGEYSLFLGKSLFSAKDCGGCKKKLNLHFTAQRRENNFLLALNKTISCYWNQ